MSSWAEFAIAAITMSLSNISGLAIFIQTYKIYHIHKTTAVAISPYFVMLVTNVFWLLYGITRHDIVIIIPCIIWVISVFSVICVYYYIQG